VPAAPDETSVLEHDVLVAARPETVFSYFTDPAKMVHWMGDEATLDPRPGGVCRVVWTAAGVMAGEFVEVVPHSRLVFRWGWEAGVFGVPPSSTEVEVSLEPEDEGTRVRLTHRRVPEPALGFHAMGWNHYFGRLAIAASGGDAGPDPLPGTLTGAGPRTQD
jgi:uncharacterized protein YndB with AHSA1/START domain